MTPQPSLLALAAAIAANTAAVERLEAALLDAKAMKRPSRRAKCQWWIRGPALPELRLQLRPLPCSHAASPSVGEEGCQPR